MQHILAARSLAHPGTRFVRPDASARERRLARRPLASEELPGRPIALGHAELGPFVQVRGGWRSLRPAATGRHLVGPVRHRVRIAWLARPADRLARRTGVAPAPWRG